ncbi:MAG: SNF2-related protein, partial [Myxococcota bacterium]
MLLADEVGLGKTIQAGVAIAELLARERDARVLIVTPAGLREQWRDELRDRFSVEAVVVDSGALARSTIELPAGVNPWSIPRVAITSIDFLKRPDVIRSLEPLVWDLVAFDEAHALSGRSDRAMAANLVAHRARRVLSITATPHNGDDQAFDRLCNLGRLEQGDRLLTFRRSRADASLPHNRSTRTLRILPTQEEAAMHRALEAYAARVNREAPAQVRPAARLAMLVLGRRACSSAASLAGSIERRIALLAAGPGGDVAQLRLPLDEQYIGEDDEPIEDLAAPGLSDLAAERRCL